MKDKSKKLLFGSLFAAAAMLLCPIYGQAKEISVPVYHTHMGTAEKGGGCHTVPQYRTQTYTYEETHGHRIEESGVCVCGNTGAPGSTCQRIVSKTGQRKVFSHYSTSCGQEEDDIVAYLKLSADTDGWTKELTLQASYDPAAETFATGEMPYVWNGGECSTQPFYQVTDNGTYTLELTNADHSIQNGRAEIVISNIDHTAPVIESYGCLPEEWTREDVYLTVTDARDLQEDGSDGCGLAEQPFLWDTMQEWCNEGYYVKDNGNVTLSVRDTLGNVREVILPVSNIDRIAPVIQSIQCTEGENLPKSVITVTAQDLQNDGSTGCGLHEQAYSWDAGKTWQSENAYEVVKNGTYTVWVRDKLGNTETAQITVENVDSYGPEILYENRPAVWTNGNVTLVIAATDKNADGSAGIGLNEAPFSWDGGKSWNGDTSYIMSANGSKTVWARDAHGNITKQKIEVNNIDKNAPNVTLYAHEDKQSEKNAMQFVLTAAASDAESGLAAKAYSWDGGANWTNEDTLQVSATGTYNVLVRDECGNTASAAIYLPLEEGGEEDTTEKSVSDNMVEAKRSTVTTSSKKVQSNRQQALRKALMLHDNSKRDTIVKGAVRLQQKESGENVGSKKAVLTTTGKQENTWGKWLLCGALLLVALFLLGLFLWLFVISVKVMTKDIAGKEILLGRCMLHKKKGGYWVFISERLYEKSETGEFTLLFAEAFAEHRKGRPLSVQYGGKVMKLTVRKELTFYLKY